MNKTQNEIGRALILKFLITITTNEKNKTNAEPNPSGNGILYHANIGNNANNDIETLHIHGLLSTLILLITPVNIIF